MPRRISPNQIESILALDGPSRYDHFIKHVVDCEQAWGLYNDGWVMGSDDAESPTFQLWPAAEYAALSAIGEWSDFEPAEIPLDDLVRELLPKLKEDDIGLSIFRTPEGQSVMPSVDQLLDDLHAEMSRYE